MCVSLAPKGPFHISIEQQAFFSGHAFGRRSPFLILPQRRIAPGLITRLA